jgi:beta-glucanase (GH16 family)
MPNQSLYREFQLFFGILIAIIGNAFAQTLIWSDEFEGSALDLDKWNVVDAQDWWDCWYAPHNIEVSDGTLKLYSREEIYNGKHWTGAKLEGKYHPQYKYLEARIRHSAPDTKIWATWWVIGWQNQTWKWPPELDICEFGTQWQPNPSQTYHWDIGGGHRYDGRNTGVDETQWHTYGVYWSATQSPIFYVDGLISYAPSGPIEGFLMEALMILSSSPNLDDHYSGCPLAVWEVDYVRVYDTPPPQPYTVHLAYQKPAIASSQENSGLSADKAVDGIESSRWASAWNDPQWLCVDLEDMYPVNQVKLYWEYASAKEYKIQISDSPNGPWVDCVHIINNSMHQGWKTHHFPARIGRYIRVHCLRRTTEWGYSIFELEVYQDCRGADIDRNGVVDMADLEVLVSYWLESDCTMLNDCEGANLFDDNQINILDFEILAGSWLQDSCSIR